AASFAVMNSRRPSTGSVFTWLWEATWPPLGIWLGWVLVVTYIVGSILQPVMFGLFFNSLLDYFGIGAGTWTAIISGLGAVAVVAVLTKKDIRLSAKVTGYFIAIEAGFVALLALYIIIKQAIDGNFTLDPFVYSNNTAGWTGFQNATLLAILAIAAFDIVAPMAEETRTPRSLVPKATIYVTIGAGLYWVFTSFGFVISVPPETMAQYVGSGEFTPIYLVADNYIHVLRILVPLTGIIAVLQDGKPLNAFAWIGVSYVFYVLIPYTLVCVANIFYHLRIARDQFNLFTNLILPLIGIAINVYVFYKNFLKTYFLDSTDFTTQSSIFWFGCAVLIILVGFTVMGVMRTGGAKQPHRFSEVAEEMKTKTAGSPAGTS